MDLGQKIKKIRLSLGMTQQKLADKSNVSKGYISMIEKGVNPTTKKKLVPTLEKISAIASAFNMTVDEVVKGTDDEIIIQTKPIFPSILDQIMTTASKLKNARQTKVLSFTQAQLDEQEGNSINILPYSDFTCYGAVSAGTGEWLGEEYKEEVTLPASIVPNQAFDFVLRVNGNSMEPLFKDNEYIFVRKTEDIRNGQIGVFVVDGEAYLKKAYLEKDCLRLVSLNKDYEDLLFNGQNDIKLVGVVVI